MVSSIRERWLSSNIVPAMGAVARATRETWNRDAPRVLKFSVKASRSLSDYFVFVNFAD
jgi:hypothetical protein